MTGPGRGRPELALSVCIPRTSVAALVDRIGREGARIRKQQGLRVRVDRGGRVSARTSVWAQKNSPPKFVGRMEQTGSDVVVRGRLRQSASETFVAGCYAGLAVFMAAIAVLAGVAGQPLPLGIGVASFLVFAGLAVLLHRMRWPVLAAQANELRGLLERTLREPES